VYKSKICTITGHENTEEEMTYSFTLYSTSALDGIGDNFTPRPLYPRERDPVTAAHKVKWTTGPVWKGAKNFIPPEFDPRTVQYIYIYTNA
jgi:hypothetical protein